MLRACLWLAGVLGAAPCATWALPVCDRLVESGIHDCNLRLGLDTYELAEQDLVELTPRQRELALGQRPLHELDPTPAQFGQIQAYCRSHGEVRRRIATAKGLCGDAASE
ncbi:MAG: hypothetical protein FGM40_04615 [Rhodocyclaceae bacterium]|nr:hypothetical protein [Rhodocyclaceae bacterium]